MGLCLAIFTGLTVGLSAVPQKALPVVQVTPVPATKPAPTANPVDEPDAGPGRTFDNLEIVDPALKGKIDVLRVGSQIEEHNNLLVVFAGFRNKTSKKLSLEVMTIYKDKSGTELNKASWIPLTLKAKEEHEYRSSSITEAATDYVIHVRRAAATPAKK